MMRVAIYHKPKPHEYEQRAIDSVAVGLKNCGFTKFSVHSVLDITIADMAIFWGYRQEKILAFQKQQRAQTLIMEVGYFGSRLDYVSLGLNGLNGRANFKNANSPPDRWEKHGVKVKPWKKDGDYILLTGQVPGDASVSGRDLYREYQQIISDIKAITDKPVVFRRHPLDNATMIDDVDEVHGELTDNLKNAYCVVTINSNSAVDAVLNGVPCICLDGGAMAWPVTQHELKDIERLEYPDRKQWLNDLAFCQWTHKEIETGEPLERLLCR